jgi:hypothetical protein
LETQLTQKLFYGHTRTESSNKLDQNLFETLRPPLQGLNALEALQLQYVGVKAAYLEIQQRKVLPFILYTSVSARSDVTEAAVGVVRPTSMKAGLGRYAGDKPATLQGCSFMRMRYEI